MNKTELAAAEELAEACRIALNTLSFADGKKRYSTTIKLVSERLAKWERLKSSNINDDFHAGEEILDVV